MVRYDEGDAGRLASEAPPLFHVRGLRARSALRRPTADGIPVARQAGVGGVALPTARDIGRRERPLRLTVLSVAYPLVPVRPDVAGASEQVLSALDRALVAGGHESIVVAAQGSSTAGTLHEVPLGDERFTPEGRDEVHRWQRLLVNRVLREQHVDLVHLHGVDFLESLPPPGGPPCLVTLHMPVSSYPPGACLPQREHTWIHGVSRAQHAELPRTGRVLAPIANGVQVPAEPPEGRRGEHVLALGCISPEKGFHLALAAAHRAGVPLALAGTVFPFTEHVSYFRERIRPLLDPRRRFLGPAGGAMRRELLRTARCLLVTNTGPEPSCLVAMEALAAGVPVVAFRSGALPEIVTHGRTGFLVEDVEEMARAIPATDGLDPLACQEEARQRFSVEVMTRHYLTRYRWLVRRSLGVRHALPA